MLFESTRLNFDFFTWEDFDDYHSLMRSLPVMQMITGRALPMEESKKRFQLALESQNTNMGTGRLKVSRKEDSRFVGLVKMVPFESEFEVGYALKQEMWGNGYGSEICGALVNYCQSLPHIQRIHAITALDNHTSKRILIKNGFALYKTDKYEGEPAEFFHRCV